MANTTVTPAVRAGEINSKKLVEILTLCLYTPMKGTPGAPGCVWGLTPHICGEPGVSKTMVIESFPERYAELPLEMLLAAQHPPEDFSGALIPDGKGDANQICPLGPVRQILKKGRGIIFLDEINGAPPAVQAAVQSFINERRAGDMKMPGGVRIITASNPDDIATGGNRLSSPLANRLVHIDYDGGTHLDWINWNTGSSSMQLVKRSSEEVEAYLAKHWASTFTTIRGLFNGFIYVNSAALHNRPAKGSKDASRAWPSRRTWDFAQRAWATYAILSEWKDEEGNPVIPHSEEARNKVIRGCVGDGYTMNLFTYMRQTNLPKPEDVLNGEWRPNKNRLDIAIAAYTTMAAYVLAIQNKKDRNVAAVKAWDSLAVLIENGIADVCVPIMQTLIDADLGRSSNDPAIKDASAPIYTALKAQGLLFS